MHLLVKCFLFIVSLIFSPSILCCLLSFGIWARQWRWMQGSYIWVEGHTGSLAGSHWHSDSEEQLAANYSHMIRERSPRQAGEALRGLPFEWGLKEETDSPWGKHVSFSCRDEAWKGEQVSPVPGHQVACGACRVAWGRLSQVVSMWPLC